MALETDLMISLRAVLNALGDEVLEVMSSRGLLRRAKKDLASGTLNITEPVVSESTIEITMDGFTVILPKDGPKKAVCSCPSTSCCRHILALCLAVREDHWKEIEAPDSKSETSEGVEEETLDGIAEETSDEIEKESSTIEMEIRPLTWKDIQKWAGKKNIRDARSILQNEKIEMSTGHELSIGFPTYNVTCWFVENGGLEGMICSCGSTGVCQHMTAAILAFKASLGEKEDIPEKKTISKVSLDKIEKRSLVTARSLDVMRESIALGLSHVSDGAQTTFMSLGMEAGSADLPRLAKELRTISDEIGYLQKRDANADEGRLLGRLSRTHALCSAIQNNVQKPKDHLVGRSQSKYSNVPEIDLAGLGAYEWETRSGYRGLTVIFWSPGRNQWFTWTDSRPAFKGVTISPINVYTSNGPWTGMKSPETAARSRFRLFRARQNQQHRLSSSKESSVMVLGKTVPAELDLGRATFSDWALLHEHLLGSISSGLKPREQGQTLCIIRPSRWGKRSFDPVTQSFTWIVEDVEKRKMTIKTGFDKLNEKRIRLLEQINPTRSGIWGVVGNVYLQGSSMMVYPISLLRVPKGDESAVVDLTFDLRNDNLTMLSHHLGNLKHAVRSKIRGKNTGEPGGNGSEISQESGESNSWKDSLHQKNRSTLEMLITRFMGELQLIAEHGTKGLKTAERDRLRMIMGGLDDADLGIVSNACARLIESRSDIPSHLLTCYYLSQLALETLTNLTSDQMDPDMGKG